MGELSEDVRIVAEIFLEVSLNFRRLRARDMMVQLKGETWDQRVP